MWFYNFELRVNIDLFSSPSLDLHLTWMSGVTIYFRTKFIGGKLALFVIIIIN
jgi:hypothetical protein